MNALLPYLGDGPVLELGCGNGKALHPMVAAGVDVVALDISWHALRRLDHPSRVLGDAAQLPFVDGAFTAVLDLHCTGHLLADGRRQAAAEAFRVLSPGGHCVVERLHPDDLRAAHGDAVEANTRRLADGRTTHFSDEAALNHERSGAGFQKVWAETTVRTPSLRGQTVTRASTRAAFQRPL